MIFALAGNAKVLWYLTRGTGAVALLLLTAALVLGVLTSVRFRTERWPRFLTAGLHRNLTLFGICFVAVHVGTTIADGYAPIGVKDAVIPFTSHYRPIWLGLGAVAFDLLLALVATSLVRPHIGYRLWRQVHWLAYASWPVALVHALGTGSDARAGWLRIVGFASLAAVGLAALARVGLAREGPVVARVAGALVTLVAPAAVVAWYQAGPAARGWAARAGTPATLLASRPLVVAPARTHPAAPPPAAARFRARLAGTIHESSDPNGLVHVVIAGRLKGGGGGAVRIDLRGQALQGGVAMTASGVSYVPAHTRTVYLGSVGRLDGTRVSATVSAASGGRFNLDFVLSLDAARGTAGGSVVVTPRVSA
jgi:DMSO/TMAO reductase YedYZ heme-binding membrane subunit